MALMDELYVAVLSAAILVSAPTAAFAKGEPEPGDVSGEGAGHPVMIAKGEPEPGDVPGEGAGHPVTIAKGEPEPGDVPGEGAGHPLA